MKAYPPLLTLVVFTRLSALAGASLLAHYSFDRDFTDVSSNGNDLVVAEGTPSITTVAGEWVVGGGALDTDSTVNDREFLSLTAPFAFAPTDPWSIVFWARRRPGSDDRQGMVIGDTANTRDFIWLSNNPTQVQGLRFRSSGNNDFDYGAGPDDGAWHHWALVADGSGALTAYRDNVPVGSSSGASTALSVKNVAHAYNTFTHSMNGQIDELYVYDEALGAAEVAELYGGGDPGPGPEADRIRVVLLAGQSNADGRADPAGLPADLQEPQADVDFYYGVSGGGTFTTLRPLSQFGPEITLGRTLADLIGVTNETRVAIVKYAAGATDLQNDWKAGGDASTTGDGSHYVVFQQTVTAGLAALAAAYPDAAVDIEGVVWVQGERDARNGLHAVYEANLVAFIADVRLTYGEAMPFVVVRLSSGQTSLPIGNLNAVRAAQTAVAAADPRSALVDSDGFGLKTDDLHFNAVGQQGMGVASAHALLSLVPWSTPISLRSLAGGHLEMTVRDALSGYPYLLQTHTELGSNGWADVELLVADGPLVVFMVTPSDGQRQGYFRVERSPAP